MPEDDFPEINTGNGYSANLAATTNDRLKKTVVELRGLNSAISKLDTDLKSFSTSSDKWSKKLVYLTWVLIVFTIILVGLTVFLIVDARDEAESQNNIALNSLFFNSVDTGIINAIENNQPILLENKGKYSDAQLDNYLGSFDTVEASLDNHSLNESDFCDSFSYFTSITAKDSEIQNYIADQQKQDPGFFTSVKTLADRVSNSKDDNCK